VPGCWTKYDQSNCMAYRRCRASDWPRGKGEVGATDHKLADPDRWAQHRRLVGRGRKKWVRSTDFLSTRKKIWKIVDAKPGPASEK
jgi:hypothetical protein